MEKVRRRDKLHSPLKFLGYAIQGQHSTSVSIRFMLTCVCVWVYQSHSIRLGPASKDGTISMTFAVKQQNLKLLTETLLKVSDPRNPEYGQHLTKEQVDKLVAPSAAAMASVQEFASSHAGVSHCEQSSSGDMVRSTLATHPLRFLLTLLRGCPPEPSRFGSKLPLHTLC